MVVTTVTPVTNAPNARRNSPVSKKGSFMLLLLKLAADTQAAHDPGAQAPLASRINCTNRWFTIAGAVTFIMCRSFAMISARPRGAAAAIECDMEGREFGPGACRSIAAAHCARVVHDRRVRS